MSGDLRTYAVRKRQTCGTCARAIAAGEQARVRVEGSGRDTWRTYYHAGPCPGPTAAERREATRVGEIDWAEAYDAQRDAAIAAGEK